MIKEFKKWLEAEVIWSLPDERYFPQEVLVKFFEEKHPEYFEEIIKERHKNEQ